MERPEDLEVGKITHLSMTVDDAKELVDHEITKKNLVATILRFNHNLEVHGQIVNERDEAVQAAEKHLQALDDARQALDAKDGEIKNSIQAAVTEALEQKDGSDQLALKGALARIEELKAQNASLEAEIIALKGRLLSQSKMGSKSASSSSSSTSLTEEKFPSPQGPAVAFTLRPIDPKENPNNFVRYVRHASAMAYATHDSEKIRLFLDAVQSKWLGWAFCRNLTSLDEVCNRFLKACRTLESSTHAIEVGGNLKITVGSGFHNFVLEASRLYQRLADEGVEFPPEFWDTFIRSKLGGLLPKFVHCRTAEDIFDHGLDLELQGRLFDYGSKTQPAKKTHGYQHSTEEKTPQKTKSQAQDATAQQPQQKPQQPHQGNRAWNDNSREKNFRSADNSVNAVEQDNSQPFETYGVSTKPINKPNHSS